MKTSYKTVGLPALVGFLLSAGNLFAAEPTTVPKNATKQVKSKAVKSIKTQKPTKGIKESPEMPDKIWKKGQKEAGVLVEPTALE